MLSRVTAAMARRAALLARQSIERELLSSGVRGMR
jgi:hypothetical protein